MRFYTLLHMNDTDSAYANDPAARSQKKRQIASFASEKAGTMLQQSGHLYSHKPFNISEVRFCLGDTMSH